MSQLVVAELKMLAVLAFGYGLALIVHEAGHVVMILALGFELRLVRVGTGPLLMRLRFGKTWLVVRLLPVYAYVMMLPPPPGRRAGQIAVTAAGALANAGCGLLLGVVAWMWPARVDVVLLLALPQVCVIAGVLLPAHGRYGGARLPSDGLRIWYLFTRPGYSTLPGMHAALMRDVLPPGAPPQPLSAASGEIVFQALRPDRLGDPWAARNAALALRGVLQDDALPSLECAFVLTFLALSELLFRNTGATDGELERWSAEALGLTPAPLPAIVWAGVRIEHGEFDVAQAGLQAVAKTATDGIQPALLQAFLARALAGQGHQAAAANAMRLARASVPKPQSRVMQPILARIEAHFAVAADQPATMDGWRQRAVASARRC